MLQNIGIPGLVLLLCVLALLYFVVRNYNRYSEVGEASRTKYIAVWFLIGFIANFSSTILSEVWINSFPNSVLRPPENLLLFACYYAISLTVTYYIFIIIHSFFTTIIRKKIIPYIWLGSIVGVLASIGQLSEFKNSNLYPDFIAYNVTAVVLLQLLYIALISRWIRKNPGFEPKEIGKGVETIHRKEPKINSSSVKLRKSETHVDHAQTKNEESKYVLQPINSVESTKDQEPTSTIQVKTEIPITDSLSRESLQNSNISSEPNLGMSLDEGSEIRRQELREFLYAASKFGDIEEILSLLSQLGFSVTRDQDQFKIKDIEGLERVIEDEKNLTIFAKRLSVQ